MRIIGGQFRSRVIKTKLPKNIRPTSDRVREAIFNILNNYLDFENLVVLDLFSGTGLLGFESLSRGAKEVTFVEKNRKSIEIIKSVSNDLNIPKDNISIYKDDVLKYLKNIDNNTKFDIIFADPPYFEDAYTQLIELFLQQDLLLDDGLFILEFHTGMKVPYLNKLNIISSRNFGDTSFLIIGK